MQLDSLGYRHVFALLPEYRNGAGKSTPKQ
jgi:hypothetical protein